MHKDKIKKLLACALAITMLLPVGITNAFAEEETDAAEETVQVLSLIHI